MNELQNVIKYYQLLADTLPKDLKKIGSCCMVNIKNTLRL